MVTNSRHILCSVWRTPTAKGHNNQSISRQDTGMTPLCGCMHTLPAREPHSSNMQLVCPSHTHRRFYRFGDLSREQLQCNSTSLLDSFASQPRPGLLRPEQDPIVLGPVLGDDPYLAQTGFLLLLQCQNQVQRHLLAWGPACQFLVCLSGEREQQLQQNLQRSLYDRTVSCETSLRTAFSTNSVHKDRYAPAGSFARCDLSAVNLKGISALGKAAMKDARFPLDESDAWRSPKHSEAYSTASTHTPMT